MIETNSGKRYCVEMLGQYLGLSESNEFSGLLGTICVILSMLLPALVLILGAFWGYRNFVNRKNELQR